MLCCSIHLSDLCFQSAPTLYDLAIVISFGCQLAVRYRLLVGKQNRNC